MSTERTHGAAPTSHTRRHLFGLAAAGGAAGLLAGCALPVRGAAVPTGQAAQATVLGIPNERFYPLQGTEALNAEFFAALKRRQKALGLALDRVRLLAVSGGGENGAFGAGLLNGWSAHGTRPEFELVTGVSTGALTAPFAFLGTPYDAQLRSVYTDLKPSEVLEQRIITSALWDDGLADNSALLKTISRYLTTDMQAAIAKAYGEGRLLLIASTNLDAQQPVIWNVGAIAASSHPRALDTIRRLLLASAAIPGAFPPTMFDVTLDGVAYQEMHVDGGAFAQAFLYPPTLTILRRERMKKGQPLIPVDAYIIRNGRLDPEWAKVERRTLGIAGRAISTMIAASGYNDVVRIYATTQRDDVGYHLAYIHRDFTKELPQPFDQGFMRALYDYGYGQASNGYDWATRPPIL